MSSASDTKATDQRPRIAHALTPRDTAWLAYQALDLSDDIILLIEGSGAAPDAVVIAANGAFRRACGFSDADLIGRPIGDLFPIQEQADALSNAIRDGVSLRAELTCRRADGADFVLGLHLMPTSERTPGRSCFAILGRDITAQIEARRMQDSIQRLLAKVFMSVDEAVVIASATGRVLMTNTRIDQLLGYRPDELVGRRSLDLVAPEHHAPVAATIKRQFETGGDQYYVAPFLRADGSQIVAGITSVLVTTEDRKQFRILTIRAQGMRTESAGHLKLAGLGEVRASLGERWQSVAKRAMTTADAVIKSRLGDDDSYCQVDDTSLLICFGALTEREASFRVATIGREIRERLIGQGSDPSLAEVRGMAAAVRFPDRPGKAASLHTAALSALDAQSGRLEHEARQTLREAVSTASCPLKRVAGQTPRETAAMQAELSIDLERAIFTAFSVLPAQETRAFDLDGLLLGIAARHAMDGLMRDDADTTPILVRVRFDVVNNRAATDRYLAAGLRIDKRVSARLILMLSSLPPGLPKSRLVECVMRLLPFCRSVGYQVDDLAGLEVIDVSHNADPIVSLPATVLETEEPAKLMAIVSSLHERRARVMIRDVETMEDAASFRTIGADMISMRDPRA